MIFQVSQYRRLGGQNLKNVTTPCELLKKCQNR
jgi:hypothetical protein